MRLVAGLIGALAMMWSAAAYAEPVSYTCARTSTQAFTLEGGEARVAPFALDETAQTLLIDWQRRTMRIGPSSAMPMLVEERRAVAIMQTVTPAAPGRPTQNLYGTYILDRTSGVLTGSVHVTMVGSMVALQFVYQCRTADGATSF